MRQKKAPSSGLSPPKILAAVRALFCDRGNEHQRGLGIPLFVLMWGTPQSFSCPMSLGKVASAGVPEGLLLTLGRHPRRGLSPPSSLWGPNLSAAASLSSAAVESRPDLFSSSPAALRSFHTSPEGFPPRGPSGINNALLFEMSCPPGFMTGYQTWTSSLY